MESGICITFASTFQVRDVEFLVIEWKVGRVIDRAGLEIRYTPFGYRGFESLTFRLKKETVMVSFFSFFSPLMTSEDLTLCSPQILQFLPISLAQLANGLVTYLAHTLALQIHILSNLSHRLMFLHDAEIGVYHLALTLIQRQ